MIDPVPSHEGGPERLFRLDLRLDAGAVSASMPCGPWLAVPDGSVAAGSVGVLVDDVLGYALVAARPPGGWSVSAEITLDLLRPLPTSGSVHAEGRVDHVDGLGGFASGRVTDDAGQVVATCSQRGRFVPAPDAGAAPRPVAPVTPVAGSEDVVPWLDRTYAGGAAAALPDVLTNPTGNLHGGVSVCLSDLVARRAVADHLVTASIHVVYTRAVPAGATLSYAAHVRHAGRSLAVVEVVGSVGGRPGTVAQVVLHPRLT